MTTIYDIDFDSSHDMHLDGQDIAFTEYDYIVRQRLAIRLQFFLEEWFLDVTQGLPYTQTIFEAQTSLEDTYIIIRDEIINTPGVETLNELELTPTPDEKLLSVTFNVNNGVSDTVEVSI